jgi:hypothetical protein
MSDDYQDTDLSKAERSGVRERAEITAFTDDVVDVLGFALGGLVAYESRSGQITAKNQP